MTRPSNNNSNDHVLPLFDNRRQEGGSDPRENSKNGRTLRPSRSRGALIVTDDTVDFGTLKTGTNNNNNKLGSSTRGSCSRSSSVLSDGSGPTTATTTATATTNSPTPNTRNDRPSMMSVNRIPTMINNRQLVYVPIRLACGIRVYCSPEVLSTDPGVLRSLQADLTRIFRVLPRSVHCLIRRTNIWLNKSYMYGERADPQIMRHLTTHHEEGWLIHCAHDIPQKARGIEIYSCQDFQRMRLHWNGSGLLLHEYCHLIHQFCVEDGLDNDQVSALYRQAQASGRYERVLRRDWAGMDVDHDMAYAMVDRKEFFAEMSVTFLSNGYHTLDKADWNNMGSCTPPLLHPTVTDRVMRQHEHGIYSKQHSTGKVVDNTMVISHTGSRESSASSETGRAAPLSSSSSPSCWMPLVQALFPNHDTLNKKIRMVDHMFQEVAMSRNCINVPHCNKFYPFTRGQLQHYDKDLFRGIQALWKEIAMWDDPNGNNQSWCHSCSP